MLGPEILAKLVTDNLTAFAVKEAVDTLVRLANDKLPGANDDEKQKWVTKELLAGLEKYDNRVPVIGKLLDIPILDEMEGWAVNYAVAGAFAKVKAQTVRTQQLKQSSA